ncbi:unnamed protein product [Rotaria sp. Silwood2]|nr:unnamed protein product [Rotaria sp. Silwood2]CAF2935964.1 unnamed protein product [Rotaria sp. Silwood2]CAF3314409.1 unnamed protein product [Rotaria sp. Silwood2]CAF3902951.1 unnamed protein product [Rotaria sp. Silwood2]CAF3989675.1 unnamed protein product [Rotaria sp. Silwood2]
MHVHYCIPLKDIQLVRQQFKEQNRLLMKTYRSHGMYSCSVDEFESNVSKFFTQTNAYHLIETLKEPNSFGTATYLADLVNAVKTMLDHLVQQQSINSKQRECMQTGRCSVQSDYLFFLPDTRKNGFTLQPMMVSSTSPFANMSQFVNDLLQPIYRQFASNTSYFKGADAIRALEQYQKQNYLRSTTIFATLHIHPILTVFDHEHAIQTLERFLNGRTTAEQMRGISISTILRLVRLVLEQQWFIYDGKVYKQVRVGSCDSPLIVFLANLILFDWEQE